MADENFDSSTPRHSLLSGRFKQSFAYLTLRSRMPGILEQIDDHFVERTNNLITLYGPEVQKDIRHIRDQIIRLSSDLLNDRTFTVFTGCEPDKVAWNSFTLELPHPKRSYFRACWLHAECYLYRKLYSFVENSNYLKGYDYFADLKQDQIKNSLRAMEVICNLSRKSLRKYEHFKYLLGFNLWSNRIQFGSYNNDDQQSEDAIKAKYSDMEKNILVDDTVAIWNCLQKANQDRKTVIVDFICDNAGFEFYCDMIFVEYLIDMKLASKVRLHVKIIPWYISDVMEKDIYWMFDYLKRCHSRTLNGLGQKWENYMREGKIEIGHRSHFWTGPQAYFVMCEVDPVLFKDLTHSQLAIFKGDLNYRKLMGDYIWDSTEEFITCLRGFRPTNICALRTIKSEVVCGLPEGKSDYLLKVDPQWMITGTYGLIQYTDSLKCCCCFHDDDETKEQTLEESKSKESLKKE